MNIKQHTLQSGERVLLVELPSDAVEIKHSKIGNWLSWMIPDGDYLEFAPIQDLPQGNWKLIGLSDEITEEQAKELVLTRVDQSSFPTSMEYYNYLSDRIVHLSFDFDTALESFKSLMQYLECHTENPYGEKPICGCKNSCSEEQAYNCGYEHSLWQEAQSKVGRYAVLKEVKA